jgi:cobyrinic acid a,c-diamide synthase
MKKQALLISAIASNQGKTLLTMALLQHFKNSVRPYKCGPDFIDPQFHARIAQTPSINLDGYMMNEEQLRWLFNNTMDKDIAILEGVMGYYDGMDKGASAYDVAKRLGIASLLIIDGSGSYITTAAVVQGLKGFRDDNTIKAVVINKVSSKMHYELIKKHIEAECADVVVCGWIEKNLPSLASTHLGLDLRELELAALESIARDVLKHIDMELLTSLMVYEERASEGYPFEKIEQKDEVCVLVRDENFSFVYEDNVAYLRERYKELRIIKSTKDEAIPSDADTVILPGGYVETEDAYARLKNANRFKASLIAHAEAGKQIYAECAGLIYLGERIDEKEMSGILPITFALTDKRERLGYYKCELDGRVIKGHAFHYSKVLTAPPTDIKLYKVSKKSAKEGGWKQGSIFATYLHTMWRVSGLSGID